MQSTDDPSAIWVADEQGQAAEDLDGVANGLIAEFTGQLPDTIIIEHVVLACQQLSFCGVLAGLAPATESLARARLRAVATPGGAK